MKKKADNMQRSVSAPHIAHFSFHKTGNVLRNRDAQTVIKRTVVNDVYPLDPTDEYAALQVLSRVSPNNAAPWLDVVSPNHETIVAPVTCCARDDMCCLVTRYYALPDLFQYCEWFEEGLPWRIVLPVVRALTRALALCHLRGVTHGDLKPENVLVCPRDCTVRLLDFAFSVRDVGHLVRNKGATMVGRGVGTPPFLAPEVTLHNRRSRANFVMVDMYALGVTLTLLACYGRDNDADNLEEGVPWHLQRDLLARGWSWSYFEAAQACMSVLPMCRPSALQVLKMLAKRA